MSIDMTKAKSILTKEQPPEIEFMEINLDEIKNPNPALLKEYEENNAMALFPGSMFGVAEYDNEKRIFEASKASGSPVKHNITGIYRKKVGSREFVFFHEHIWTRDYFQNSIDHTRFLGRYEKPMIVARRVINAANIKNDKPIRPELQPPEIEGYQTTYEWEFSAIKPQLVAWEKHGIINENTKYYAWIDQFKYSKPYSWDEFINLSLEDLVLLGKIGTRFDGIIKPGDTASIETLRQILREELQKGVLKA